MIIGIPKEIMHDENRVSATPQTVKKYLEDGMTVLVENGAGLGAHFTDEDYVAAGATLYEDVEVLYQKADVIIKVKEPQFHEQKNKHEIDMMKKGQYLITFLHPAATANHDMVRKLAEQGVTSLTLDGVPRITRAQNMDALTSMSTCAGYKGMIMAVNTLTKFVPMIIGAVGTIKPANVLVVGAGVAGLQAIATAKRLGAVVYAADIREEAQEQAKSLAAKIVDLKIPQSIAVGKGGYAKMLSKEWIEKEKDALADVIKEMDIVYLSALVPGKLAPVLVSEKMVQSMRQGSVIVDISIDQGGNCEITTPGKIEQKHGVCIQGIKNLPGQLPASSTWMFANNMYQLVRYLTRDGNIYLDHSDDIVSSIIVTEDGHIRHEGALEAMGLSEE